MVKPARQPVRCWASSESNRLLAPIARRRKDCPARKAIGSAGGMRRAHRHFCYDPEAIEGKPFLISPFLLLPFFDPGRQTRLSVASGRHLLTVFTSSFCLLNFSFRFDQRDTDAD